MDRAWFGFARMLVFLGSGILVLRRAWKARRGGNGKFAVADELLLLGSGALVALALIGGIFWFGTKDHEAGSVTHYLGILLLLALAVALTHPSNRILRRSVRGHPGIEFDLLCLLYRNRLFLNISFRTPSSRPLTVRMLRVPARRSFVNTLQAEPGDALCD